MTRDVLAEVLAYLPPAPFTMPVLVGLGTVAWWEFTSIITRPDGSGG